MMMCQQEKLSISTNCNHSFFQKLQSGLIAVTVKNVKPYIQSIVMFHFLFFILLYITTIAIVTIQQ